MIRRFLSDTALLMIDVQVGVDVLDHWGGPTGRRNNPGAEGEIARVLAGFRANRLPVIYTQHDSREAHSPLKINLPTGAFKPGLGPVPGEAVIRKDVNSGFIGTHLEILLRRAGVGRLVVVGFFTNMCVETTVRMAGNLGFDTYLVPQACATTNRIGLDGTDYDPERVHAFAVANLHREFCTALEPADVLQLLEGDAPQLTRSQGNE